MPIAKRLIEEDVDVATLVFCGDIMVRHGDVIPQLHSDIVKFVDGCDLFIGNCEAPVHTGALNTDSKYRFSFHMPSAYLTGIIDQLPIDRSNILLNTANNHSGDAGYLAYVRGLEILRELGLSTIGTIQSSECDRAIYDIRGLKLGFLSWTQWMNCKIFGGQDIRPIEQAEVLSSFGGLKEKEDIDYLVATPHWEYEFQHFPHHDTRQTAIVLAAELGIDLIAESHPHTLQPLEVINSCHCFYSLGNFIGLGISWPVKLIPLLKVKIGVSGSSKGKMVSYEVRPYVQSHDGDGISLIPIESAIPKMRKKMQSRLDKVFTPLEHTV